MEDLLKDPYQLALRMCKEVAQKPDDIGECIDKRDCGDNVVEYHFNCLLRGYESWHWVTSLYHDEENGIWTVNETSLAPSQGAILPPPWIPWSERLRPEDLSPTDSLGTDPHDPRMESGVDLSESQDAGNHHDDGQRDTDHPNSDHHSDDDHSKDEHGDDKHSDDSRDKNLGDHHFLSSTDQEVQADSTVSRSGINSEASGEINTHTESTISVDSAIISGESTKHIDKNVSVRSEVSAHKNIAVGEKQGQDSSQAYSNSVEQGVSEHNTATEYEDLVQKFQLTRKHVMTAQSRWDTAQRWYEGPPGPKSLSTTTAQGEVCSQCAFFIPLQGDLQRLFGVCANKWSREDAKVVSVDHGCGEHSEIAPAEPTQLWIQSEPAYDSLYIDVVSQVPRDENAELEMLEESLDTSDNSQDSQELSTDSVSLNSQHNHNNSEDENI